MGFGGRTQLTNAARNPPIPAVKPQMRASSQYCPCALLHACRVPRATCQDGRALAAAVRWLRDSLPAVPGLTGPGSSSSSGSDKEASSSSSSSSSVIRSLKYEPPTMDALLGIDLEWPAARQPGASSDVALLQVGVGGVCVEAGGVRGGGRGIAGTPSCTGLHAREGNFWWSGRPCQGPGSAA